MERRALLIINTKSRTGKDALNAAVAGLHRHGIDAEHRECDTRERLSPLIMEHSGSVDLVVVGGGDGTLNAAAAGLLAAKRPLGIIPTGTANDLARTLNIPSDIDSAIRIIAAGNTRLIDLGSVNNVPFFNVASIGLSTALAGALTEDIKRRFGKLGYAIAAIKVIMQARPFNATISDPRRSVRSLTLQVTIGNGRFYGGGNIVASNAEIDDGQFHLYSLEFLRAWRLILMFASFRKGEHVFRKDIRNLQGIHFEVQTRRPRHVNADGEILTETPAVFRVLPRALEVIVPNRLLPPQT